MENTKNNCFEDTSMNACGTDDTNPMFFEGGHAKDFQTKELVSDFDQFYSGTIWDKSRYLNRPN
jgi:hypothetical protein